MKIVSQRGKSKEETKIRVLAVAKMISEGRRITSGEILRRLDVQYDIQADRKTIYGDIYAINRFIPIDIKAGANGGFMKLDVFGGTENG